jgi:cytochrome o ubiquinol oxidase operon protein cyoD
MSNTSGPYHGSFKTYLIGFVICVALSAAAFLVLGKRLFTSDTAMLVTIISLAVVQLLVQLKCFLHLSFRSEARWNVATLAFSAIIIFILVAGSLWIMFSLNTQMMPH